jgi:adenylate cyclase class 2
MPIEAELKARVRDQAALLSALDARAKGASAVYRDRYFDSPDGAFTAAGHELRIRSVETREATRHLLTYKAPAVDQASGSKPEHETRIADPAAAAAIVHGLGYRTKIAFTKNCRNYSLHEHGRDLLATVVTVPEIDGTFLEVETIVQTEDDLSAALDTVRAVLSDLGIDEVDLTDELYTDAVAKAAVQGPADGITTA